MMSFSQVSSPHEFFTRFPCEVVEVLNKAVNAGLADPKLKARLADLGSVPLPGQPGTFGKLIADEIEKWGKVIRFAGIKSQ
jgi:tripartite-type tricarboxylate transporter receptor subunit TctC